MKHSSMMRSLVVGVCVLLCMPLVGWNNAQARPRSHAPTRHSATQRERVGIVRALRYELNQHTTGHVRVSSFSVSRLEVDGNYAFAKVNPLKPAELDPVFVLLRKRSGRWKVATLGTNMKGAGKEYGVPHRLWTRWGL